MEFTGYHWDEHNIRHLAWHDVKPSEFEEVMGNAPTFWSEEERNGELRTRLIGHTNGLRVLFVVWTPRGTRIRPVSAFDPPRHVVDEYLEDFYEKE